MEWEIANTPDTKFRLGSITKQFTAMLVMQQIDQGKLKLDGTTGRSFVDVLKIIPVRLFDAYLNFGAFTNPVF